MSSFGLKTNIAVNIGLILFFGMLLTAFMVTNLMQRALITGTAEKGTALLSAAQEAVSSVEINDRETGSFRLTSSLRRILADPDVSGYHVIFPESGHKIEYYKIPSLKNQLTRKAIEASQGGTGTITLVNDGWGVFWKHKRHILLAGRSSDSVGKKAGISIIMPLESVFQKIRTVLSIILLYIIINALILTAAGVYQISKSAVKPVHRLLKRAQEYRDENTPVIFEEKTENEFKQLSSALNNMLGRISGDREKLHETIASLEKANIELKKAQKEIIRAEKLASVGRLSSGIAHEIGNPLGIVSGYLELIKDDSLSTDQKEDFISRADAEIQRIDKIIRQLLDYSRKSKENRKIISITDLVNEVIDMIRIQPFMSGIAISKTIDPLFAVKADRDQLKQVFLNLLINAADAINSRNDNKDGRIILGAEIKNSNRVEIFIEDNGKGISDENIGNVFDPFFTTKDPGKGTGMGLAVCFTIIEDLDGILSIESCENIGTKIIIDLPSADNQLKNEA